MQGVLISRSAFEGIGMIAGFCTTASLLPQLVRVWRRKSAQDISSGMFLMFSFGVLCWLIYGIGVRSISMIAANAVTLALALAILALKLHYDRKT